MAAFLSSKFKDLTEKKAIYSVGNAHEWLNVAEELRAELGWNPVYWITVELNHEEVGRAFPEVHRHRFMDLNRCVPAEAFSDIRWSGLDSAILNEFSSAEQTTLELMDRMELAGTFAHLERQRTYLWMLSYWLNVLERVSPDVAIFHVPPHSPGEFVLHSVCRQRGIKIRVLLPTQLCSLHLVSDGYDRLPRLLEQNYKIRLEGNDTELSSEVRSSVENTMFSKTKAPWYINKAKLKEQKKNRAKKRIENALECGELLDIPLQLEPSEDPSNWLMKAPKKLTKERQEKLRTPMRRVYKRPNAPLTDPILTHSEYSFYLRWAYPRKIHLERVYNSLAVECDLSVPFVFFALHYQPERTTCPDGGRFNNQLLAAALIANSLPDGWRLYVKEHPSQHYFHRNGEQSRNTQFYDDLAALPNTSLVVMEQPTAEFVANANAVATITGYIGWEALLRGIPVLVFGSAWYRKCRGAYPIRTQHDADSALNAIVEGNRHSVSDAVAFAGALEDSGEIYYLNTEILDGVQVSSETGKRVSKEKQIKALLKLIINHEKSINI